VAPNPCRAAAMIVVETAAAGEQHVVVCDVQGRAVRHLEHGTIVPGTRRIAWDGRDDAGVRLAPGIYRVLVKTPGRNAGARIVLLP
jgi:flagellar hook assembly protein FlgD